MELQELKEGDKVICRASAFSLEYIGIVEKITPCYIVVGGNYFKKTDGRIRGGGLGYIMVGTEEEVLNVRIRLRCEQLRNELKNWRRFNLEKLERIWEAVNSEE